MDLSASIEPKSDQLDAVDLLSGPRTFTVKSVTAGNSEQPVNIALEEFPRVWRPSKSMRRVLVAAWGKDGSKYKGRRLTLYCDPDVEFGGIKVGGTRISHMSHIDKPLAVALLVKRGKSAMFAVQPLTNDVAPATPSEPSATDIDACTDQDQLRAWWQASGPETRALIEARKKSLDESRPANAETVKAAVREAQGVLGEDGVA